MIGKKIDIPIKHMGIQNPNGRLLNIPKLCLNKKLYIIKKNIIINTMETEKKDYMWRKEMEEHNQRMKDGYQRIIKNLKNITESLCESVEILSDKKEFKLMRDFNKRKVLKMVNEYPNDQKLGEEIRKYYNSIVYKND
jgi:di/tripeptidase